MKKRDIIWITDFTNFGPILDEMLEGTGTTNQEFITLLAQAEGINLNSAYARVWTWRTGMYTPNFMSLGILLDLLGYNLLLEPKKKR